MAGSTKLAIVTALEREVHPLVTGWAIVEREFSGRSFRFYEHGSTVLVCGGIGSEAARRATEAVISLYHPNLILSAGYAGALDHSLQVGAVVIPSQVIDARDGSIAPTQRGEGALLSYSAIAGVEQKAKLVAAYAANAVDMEAAAVARGAQAHGIEFATLKVISDEFDFSLPEMEKYIGSDGQFHSAGFAIHVAMRPWLWPNVIQLARNSAKASVVLCHELSSFIAAYTSSANTARTQKVENSREPVHPINSSPTLEEVRK